MADAVEHDLSDRALAVLVLVAGFVIDRAREAVERLRAGRGIALELERRRGRIGPAATGISALSFTAWSGASGRTSIGGGAGGAAAGAMLVVHNDVDPSRPPQPARTGRPERSHADRCATTPRRARRRRAGAIFGRERVSVCVTLVI